MHRRCSSRWAYGASGVGTGVRVPGRQPPDLTACPNIRVNQEEKSMANNKLVRLLMAPLVGVLMMAGLAVA